MVVMVMMMVAGRIRRTGEHHQQQSSSNKLLHRGILARREILPDPFSRFRNQLCNQRGITGVMVSIGRLQRDRRPGVHLDYDDTHGSLP